MNNKIGVFDSGIGGLSVLKEMVKILPNEDYLYYGDSINNPYGEKTQEELFEIACKVVDYLISKECKIIVIACNTATTACISMLREKYKDMIFVGTVPAIKVAYDKNYKNTIILSTKYTNNSAKVKELIHDYTKDDQNIILISGKSLAHLIDINDMDSIRTLLKELLSHYNGVADSIVLGCTHYPLVKKEIQKVLPDVAILDGSVGVANEVKHQLEKHNLLNPSINKGSIIIENSKDQELVNRSYEILNEKD